MQSTRRVKRQSAVHIFASEYGESTLSEKGSGEFDPSFVITKLGSRINRVIVAGLLERIEGRDVSTGSVIYQGQLRDPSGVNYFSVGDYVSDSVKELTIQLVEKLETGEPIGIKRLIARPVAELCIAAQEKHEKEEKVYADN